ncbi:MAG TPA: type II toxin-antitoxin system VapC family toxin [Nitriliruptorales bacterium]
MRLPDVNILVNALRPDAPDHERCRTWLEGTVNDPRPFALAGEVLSGAIRILTHPRVFDPPSDRRAVVDQLDRLLAAPNAVVIRPGPRHWRLFSRLLESADARGNLVPDAWLAAIAIEHGCTFVTLDQDYARFGDLEWTGPDR